MTGHITFVRFTIVLTESGGVTTPASIRYQQSDAVIDRDLFGRPHIPGASLAGALRHRAAETLTDPDIRTLFGDVVPSRSEATASALWIMNAPVESEPTNLRTHWTTAINRHTGAARTHTLRGTEMLPSGTTFVARMWAFDQPDLPSIVKTLLDRWNPQLGRSTSTGHGRAEIRDVTWGELDLSKVADLKLWLTSTGPDLVDKVATTPLTLSPEADADQIALHFSIDGPTRVMTAPDEPAVVPGSTVKGIIRSRIEYILRTIDQQPPPCNDQRCGECDPCRWFGHSGAPTGAAPTSATGRRGRVRFSDATVVQPHGRHRNHVALDRFTGGAAIQTRTDEQVHVGTDRGGLLYSAWALESGHFTTVLTLDRSFDPTDRQHLMTRLRQVSNDFNDRLIGIGAMTTRGYGDVSLQVTDLTAGKEVVDLENE